MNKAFISLTKVINLGVILDILSLRGLLDTQVEFEYLILTIEMQMSQIFSSGFRKQNFKPGRIWEEIWGREKFFSSCLPFKLKPMLAFFIFVKHFFMGCAANKTISNLKQVAVKIYNGKSCRVGEGPNIYSVSQSVIIYLLYTPIIVLNYVIQLYFSWLLCMSTFPYWSMLFLRVESFFLTLIPRKT